MLASLFLATTLALTGTPVRVAALCGSADGQVLRELVGLARCEKPKTLVFATAGGDKPEAIRRLENAFADCGAVVEAVRIAKERPADLSALRQKIVAADLIWFSGGSTENLLQRLNFFYLAQALRDAYRNGTVLAGYSAGANLLSFAGYNDFSDGRYDLIQGLNVVPVYYCPHYPADSWGGFDARLREETSPLAPAEAWALGNGNMIVSRDGRLEVRRLNAEKPIVRFARHGGIWTKEAEAK